MTTNTCRTKVDPSRINCAFTNPASDVDRDFNCGAPADIKQTLHFLNFTLKESIIQTVNALVQSLRCTYLLVSELHRPFLDSGRVLIPFWLAVFHAILLVFFVLVHRAISGALKRLHELASGSFARLTAWTDDAAPRVSRRLGCRSGSGPSSAPRSDPSSTIAE